MKLFNGRHMITTGAVFALLLGATSLQAENVHLGADGASTEEIIELLMPAPGKARMRGLRLKNPEQPAPRSISLEVYFGFDSAALTTQAMEQLAPVGDALRSQELEGLEFALEGHTDASGGEIYNLDLSERRALAVRNYFVEEYGIVDDKLAFVGRGEHELLDAENPTSGVNRRVKIIAN